MASKHCRCVSSTSSVSKACSHASDLEALLEGAKTQMEKWTQDSREAKMGATEEVVNIVQEAIEESIPLWYYMCLDGDRFVIDETKLQLDPPRALGLHPLPDLASYHCQVLEELVKTFKEGCPKALKEAADRCTPFIDLPQFLGAKLWFDSDNGNDSGEFIRRIFFSMLSLENGMPWQCLLLYLCKDSDTEIALRKAHAAIMGIESESVTLTSQELLQAVYPCGTEGALDQGCQIWSFHDLQKLAEKLQDKPGQEAEVYESTRGTEEPEDNMTGSDALYARSTGACMGSKLSEQSLVSFQLMPYELDESGGVSGGITSSISSEAVASMNNNENKASKEANNEKRTSNIDSYQIDNNEERQDDGDIAGAWLEVCSLFSEQAVATMNEFLVACNKALQGSRDVEKEAAFADEGERVGEVAFSLQDLLASELSPTLQARFGANTLLAMAPTFLANT